jgi:Predicted hydrolase (HAD superfamily)
MFRKPSPLLFELALRKAGVDAQTVWHCGDNPRADIEGAASVGIYPVWYDNTELNDRHESSGVTVPACEHLHIHGWSELADILSSF